MILQFCKTHSSSLCMTTKVSANCNRLSCFAAIEEWLADRWAVGTHRSRTFEVMRARNYYGK